MIHKYWKRLHLPCHPLFSELPNPHRELRVSSKLWWIFLCVTRIVSVWVIQRKVQNTCCSKWNRSRSILTPESSPSSSFTNEQQSTTMFCLLYRSMVPLRFEHVMNIDEYMYRCFLSLTKLQIISRLRLEIDLEQTRKPSISRGFRFPSLPFSQILLFWELAGWNEFWKHQSDG